MFKCTQANQIPTVVRCYTLSTEPGLCLPGVSCPRVTLLLCRCHVQNQTQQHQQTTGQAQAQNQQQTVAQQATSQQTSAQTNGTTGATGGTVGGALQHGQDQAPANKKPRIGAPTATGMLPSEYQVSVTLSGMQSPARTDRVRGFLTPLETNRNDPRTFPQQITQQLDRAGVTRVNVSVWVSGLGSSLEQMCQMFQLNDTCINQR